MPDEEVVLVPTRTTDGFVTRYRIRRSKDFDAPMAALDRLRRLHPELEIDEEAEVVLDDLRRRRREMASKEFDGLVNTSWWGSHPPPGFEAGR